MSSGPRAAGSAPTTSREVEVKLRVHGLFQVPQFDAETTGVTRVVRQPDRNLYAVYYDTDDLRLFRWGVTLRRREGGPDAGWHLKLPVATKGREGLVRDELRLPLREGQTLDPVPPELANIVFPLTRGAKLNPVADIRTLRKPYLFYDGLNTVFAEMVDDTVSVMNGAELLTRFREIEVEALATDADLAPVVVALEQAGAAIEQRSKAAIALGPAATGLPDVLEPGRVTPQQPAGELVTAVLRRYARAFILQDVRVRRDLPDAVHQMRVAARRLRSALKAFAPLVDVEWAQQLREELGWAASELGVARDTEVLLARLDQDCENLGAADARLVRAVVDPRLRSRLAQARSNALEALSGDRHRRLLDQLVEAAQEPHLTPLASRSAQQVLPQLVEKAYRRLVRRVRDLELAGPAQAWHEARIVAKRARYSVEAITEVFGKPAVELAAAFERVTELLGEHQDACVAQDVLREIAAMPSIDGRTGFALGLLHEYEFEAELHARLEFEKLWPRVVKVYRKTRWDVTG